MSKKYLWKETLSEKKLIILVDPAEEKQLAIGLGGSFWLYVHLYLLNFEQNKYIINFFYCNLNLQYFLYLSVFLS